MTSKSEKCNSKTLQDFPVKFGIDKPLITKILSDIVWQVDYEHYQDIEKTHYGKNTDISKSTHLSL